MIAIALVFAYVIGIAFFWWKHQDFDTFKKPRFHSAMILPGTLTALLLVFGVLFIVAFSKSPYNLPEVDNVSSEYHDLVDVGDGVVVVGRTRMSLTDTSQDPIHSYDTGRAYIVKYDYDGEILWDDVWYNEEDLSQASRYTSISVGENDDLKVKGLIDGDGTLDDELHKQVTYSPDGELLDMSQLAEDTERIMPHHFDEDKVLRFTHETTDLENQKHTLEMQLSKDSVSEPISFDLQYQHDIVNTYNARFGGPVVEVVYSDSDVFVLGVSVVNVEDTVVFNQLFVFDYSLKLMGETNLPEDIMHGTIQKHENKTYMLSRNFYERKSHMVLLNDDFEEENVVEITADLNYFLANAMHFEDDRIYVGGNEYETRVKEGYVEYFSGVVNVYDLNMHLTDRIEMRKGVGINDMIMKDDKLYTAGLFNTTIGLNHRINDYPWTGVFGMVDQNHQNYVLAFTQKPDESDTMNAGE